MHKKLANNKITIYMHWWKLCTILHSFEVRKIDNLRWKSSWKAEKHEFPEKVKQTQIILWEKKFPFSKNSTFHTPLMGNSNVQTFFYYIKNLHSVTKILLWKNATKTCDLQKISLE